MSEQIYWSPSTKSFYPLSLRAVYAANCAWPEDARPVSDSVFVTYGGAPPAPGQRRGCGADLMPIWEAVTEGVTKSEERIAIAHRRLFQARETILNVFVLLGKSVPPSWARYLRLLMAISSGEDTSTDIPDMPNILSE